MNLHTYRRILVFLHSSQVCSFQNIQSYGTGSYLEPVPFLGFGLVVKNCKFGLHLGLGGKTLYQNQKRDNKVVALGNPSKPSGCSNHVLKQKLKREHHLTGALRNQSNKHQNSQKPMLKAEQKKN